MNDSISKAPVDLREHDSRWQLLGGLRFLLAMVVVASHLNWFVPAGKPTIGLAELGGTAAVLGFLVVSGYSIAHSLQRRPEGFYRRRVLRIYPLYVSAVLFSLLPFATGALALRGPGFWIWRPHWWVVAGNLVMLQNLAVPPIDSDILVWTLGIEVICYLLAPWFRKMGDTPLLLLTAISAAAYALYPRMSLAHYGTLLFGIPLLLFAWAWLAGFLLHRHRRFGALTGAIVSVLGAGLMLINTAYNTRYSIPTFVGAVLIVAFSQHIFLPRLAGTILNYLGNLSYPIYLFHIPALLLAYCILNANSLAALFLFAFGVSNAFLFVESVLKKTILRPRRFQIVASS